VRKNLQEVLRKSRPRDGFDQEMLVYNIRSTPYVAEFLVQWVKNMNVAESFDYCMGSVDKEFFMSAEDCGEPEGVPGVLRTFHDVFAHFSNMTVYTNEIRDSLVDWYITYLRNNPGDLDNILMTCRRNDRVGDGALVRVCANVIVHHGNTLSIQQNREDFLCWLQDHTSLEARRGDVLSPGFVNHCAYHQHGNNEICYTQGQYCLYSNHQIKRLTSWAEMQQTPDTAYDLPFR
jgi:hypothetical protein